MSELMITHSFVRKLAANIREEYGKEIKHTQAINIVAKSLGWSDDALMHKLKNENRTEACEVHVNKTELVEHKVNKFYNNRLLRLFLSSIIKKDTKAAHRYNDIIESDDAWYYLLLSVYYIDIKPANAKENLIKAFQKDILTLQYIAELVEFQIDVSKIDANSGYHEFKKVNFLYSKPDYVAWAVSVAIDEGYLTNTNNGPKINMNPSIFDRVYNSDYDKKKLYMSYDFWAYVKIVTNEYNLYTSLIEPYKKLIIEFINCCDVEARKMMNSSTEKPIPGWKFDFEEVLELLKLETLVKYMNFVPRDNTDKINLFFKHILSTKMKDEFEKYLISLLDMPDIFDIKKILLLDEKIFFKDEVIFKQSYVEGSVKKACNALIYKK